MTARWTTRAETSLDVPAIRDINLAAFDTADEANLVEALRADPAWIDGLSVVTIDRDATVVAHALLTRCHIGEAAALCLAPCAVLPEHQNTGAGSAAIRAALQTATDQDESFVVVLGHPTYYPKFGFRRASEYGITLSITVPDDALMALALDTSSAMPAGIVRYAAPFGI